jgi:peptidoglycan/LPS O-acetylase OafA/YrhL
MPRRRRLDHIDAMRPVKQAGVISTHVLDFFAPISTAQGAVLVLLHVSREAFFFVSACMVTYAYMGLHRSGLRQFYWRRFVSVGVPYVCWTVIYFLFTLHASHYAGPRQALMALRSLFEFSYYHLYFLLVIMQFYLVFPLVLIALRRTRRYHGLVIAAVAVVQVLLATGMHWEWLPPGMQGLWAQREATTYVLYLIGGSVTAFHLDRVDAWLRRHAKLVVALTVLAAIVAEVPFYLSQWRITTALGSTTDPFQPSVIPFNIGAIACLYLAGTALVRSGRTPPIVRMGSDNSYGVYLNHMLFIVGLYWLGWQHLTATIPWPLLCLITMPTVYLAAFTLTSLLARTPLAVPLTGRTRVRLSRPALVTTLARGLGPGPGRPGRAEHAGRAALRADRVCGAAG